MRDIPLVPKLQTRVLREKKVRSIEIEKEKEEK